jgi:FkbM family methyltransferase
LEGIVTIRGLAIDIANRNRPFSDFVLSQLGKISKKSELIGRKGLRVSPDYISINYSPLRKALSRSIRMSTQRGTDQVARSIYYHGWRFERPLPALIEAALTLCPSGAFFDIGANTGLYSLVAKAAFPERTVYSFEPFPSALKILLDNISLSGLANSIIICDSAVSDETGVANFYIPPQDHGLVETSASLSSDFHSEHCEVFQVGTVRLDDCGFEPPAVMKIDVEGAEGKALRGMERTLREDRPIVFCEILATSNSLTDVLGVLESTDYSIASICEDQVAFGGIRLGANNHLLFRKEKKDLAKEIVKLAQSRERTTS